MELWTIVMPLHQPRQGIVLTYGSIVAGPDHTRVRVDDLPRAADVVRNCLRDQVEPLRCIQSSSHFLRHIARFSGNNAEVVQLDFALKHFLVGNIAEAFGILRSRDARPEMFTHHRRTVRQALDALETGPDELSHLIDRWRDANVANLALECSVRRRSSLRLINSR
jgi:hypothetical protein